jgi:hypothetical protein
MSIFVVAIVADGKICKQKTCCIVYRGRKIFGKVVIESNKEKKEKAKNIGKAFNEEVIHVK